MEPMSKIGMGVVYSKTSQGATLRDKLTGDEKQRLIDNYYLPHHERLTLAANAELVANQQCLLVDCHSFPSFPLPFYLDKSPDLPDICLGTDDFHTPEWLGQVVDALFRESGFKIKSNSPFSGTMVPLSHYKKNPAVSSILIEINRCLYMDERTGLKNEFFDKTKQEIRTILNKIYEVLLRH